MEEIIKNSSALVRSSCPIKELKETLKDLKTIDSKSDDPSPTSEASDIVLREIEEKFDQMFDNSPIGNTLEKKSSSNRESNSKEDKLPIEYIWQSEELINQKFFPLKSNCCNDISKEKEDSNANTPENMLNFSTFTTYLENNPMNKYYDNNRNDGDTPKIELSKLTIPEFIRNSPCINLRDNEYSKKSSGDINDGHAQIDQGTPINSVSNAFINMNVHNSTNLRGNNKSQRGFMQDERNQGNNNQAPFNMNGAKLGDNFAFNMNSMNNSVNNMNSVNINPNFKNNMNSSSYSQFNNDQMNFPNQNQNTYSNNMGSNNGNMYGKFYGNVNSNEMMGGGNKMDTMTNMPNIANIANISNMGNRGNRGNRGNMYTQNENFGNMNNNYNNNKNYNNNNNGNKIKSQMNPQMNQMSQGQGNSNNYANFPTNSNNSMMKDQMNIFSNNNNPNFPFSNINNSNSNSNNNNNRNKHDGGEYNIRDFKVYKVHKPPLIHFINMSNVELASHSYYMAKDQAGCRYLQKKIDEEEKTLPLMIYPHIVEHLIELMNDAFGNYLIQKLLDHLPNDKLFHIIAIINPHLSSLGINPHGTRVVQKLVSHLKTDELVSCFVKIVRTHVLVLIKDMNGNHIIQKLLNQTDSKYSTVIYDIIQENIIEISTHKHGCCVLQKCIDSAKPGIKLKLIELLISCSLNIIVDQYGNYVIQYILSLNNLEYNKKLVIGLLTNICFLSKQKYSSNVVERCFDCCDEETKNKLISSILFAEIINDLLFDMFGNYVLQKALAVANEENQTYILTIIAPMIERLRFFNFGPKLYNKLIITYPQLSTLMFNENIDEKDNNNNIVATTQPMFNFNHLNFNISDSVFEMMQSNGQNHSSIYRSNNN